MPKKTKNKKSENEKSILGKNAIFTPNVINDIHIKSQLGMTLLFCLEPLLDL